MARRTYALIVCAIALAAGVNLIAGAFGFGRTATYILGIPVLAALVLIGLPWSDDHRHGSMPRSREGEPVRSGRR